MADNFRLELGLVLEAIDLVFLPGLTLGLGDRRWRELSCQRRLSPVPRVGGGSGHCRRSEC